MPATRIRAFAHSPNSQKKAKDKHFRRLIDEAKSEQKITKSKMAEKANITRPTFLSYENNPEKMPLGVLRSLREQLGWTAEQLAEFI